MMTRKIMVAMTFALAATNGHAAEPIEGNWKTAKGEPVAITKCGGAYCITATGGKFAGRQIGRFSGKDGEYIGQLTDPVADRTYSGSGSLSGNSLKMKGCVLKVLCMSQTWTRL